MKVLMKIVILLNLMMPAAWAQKIIFIINSSNSVSRVTPDQIQDFYFKRNRTWPDGKPVRFFDRNDESELRKVFLSSILKKTSRQVDQFWIGQKLFTGDSAPTKVQRDSLVVNLVSRFPGGIGYISEGTKLGDGVKVLEISGP